MGSTVQVVLQRPLYHTQFGRETNFGAVAGEVQKAVLFSVDIFAKKVSSFFSFIFHFNFVIQFILFYFISIYFSPKKINNNNKKNKK